MRSRFHGSKRVRKTSFLEKQLQHVKYFIQNLDRIILLKSVLLIILLVILFFIAQTVLKNYLIRNGFEQNILEFASLNQETLFEVTNLTLYSSANAIDSEDGNGRIDISQFTDISFHINNIANRKITAFSISDIQFSTPPEMGNPVLHYKNPLEFGKLVSFDNSKVDTITFEVLNSDDSIHYENAYVLNNLSNPITLEYINQDIKTNFSIPSTITSLTYNGQLLKEADISLDSIAATISFHIVLVTRQGETYKCKVLIDIPLKQDNSTIYEGSILQNYQVNIYPFYRVN